MSSSLQFQNSLETTFFLFVLVVKENGTSLHDNKKI